MKRIIPILVALVVGGIGGIGAGFAGGIFVYPFWFLTDVAAETLPPDVERNQFAAGSFIHVNSSDPVHWGTGKVSLHREAGERTVLHLHDDFEVGPGPRFHVYLVDHAEVRNGDDFTASTKIDLGRLRAFKGSQVYGVPAGADMSKFKSVVIWCKEFGVLISPATLGQAGANIAAATAAES